MAGEVIRHVAEYLIIAFVAFALLFEILLHKLEHWIMHRHPHVQTMLRNLYREVMILGIISFCFIMYIFTGSPSDDIKMTFEVAHVFVFLFAVFHTFVVGLCILISLQLSQRWINLERIDILKYLEHKEQYRSLDDLRNKYNNKLWKHFGWWLTSPGKYFQYSKLHEAMAFHDIRWQFIYYRNLAPDFRFSKFLRKIKFATFVELVEIHPLCWTILIVLIGLDLLRVKIGSSPNFEAAFLIAHSCFNVIVVAIIARKIRSVYYQLTKNPATYYDTIDPAAFRAELAIAEEEWNKQHDLNSSTEKKKEVRFDQPSNDENEKLHQHLAIHHNMAYVPDNVGDGLDERYSIDVNKGQPGISNMNGMESYGNPTSATASDNLVETAKRAHQRREAGQPLLLGMATAMPVSELDHRAQPSIDIEMDEQALKRINTTRRNLRLEALRRLREKGRSAAIVETAQNLETAQSAQPKKEYHWLILKLFPRLGRVASAAEKLFWFGSHRYYLFCVELMLFFTNINLSTAIAKLAFSYKGRAYYDYQVAKAAKAAKTANVGGAVKMALTEVIRAATTTNKTSSGIPKENPYDESLVLLWIAFALGLLAMIFVLLRIADIMKKYIFVLNNANLLPENMMTQTIQTVSLKDAMEEETLRGHDTGAGKMGAIPVYDSDTDGDEFEDYSRMRRNMSTFFEREGNNTLGTGVGVSQQDLPVSNNV